MLACALVSRGSSAEAAIDRVRTLRPYSIETVEQEDCVRDFAEYLAKKGGPVIISNPGDPKKKPPQSGDGGAGSSEQKKQ